MTMKFKDLVGRKLKLSKDDEVYIFDTIKEVAEFLNLDMSKSTHMSDLSVYSKCVLDNNYYEANKHKRASAIRKGKERLGDWNLEREDIYKYYECDTLFKDYEYGWYGFHGVFGSQFMCGGKYEIFETSRGTSRYKQTRNNTLKQVPKILDVHFVSGHYKDVI